MQVRILLVGVLLAGVALVAAGPVAGRPREPEAERIARGTIAAVRASERAGLVTSLAPARSTPSPRSTIPQPGPGASRPIG